MKITKEKWNPCFYDVHHPEQDKTWFKVWFTVGRRRKLIYGETFCEEDPSGERSYVVLFKVRELFI